MKRKKRLKENSFLLSQMARPNYVIRPLGAMDVNNRSSLDAGWVNRRMQEEEMRNQYSYMIGNLDNADKMFIQLFQQITDLRNFIDKQQNWPLITKEQSRVIKEINKKLDNCNKVIVTEIIPLIDELSTKIEQN